MLQFPKDLSVRFPHIFARNADTAGVVIPKNSNYSGGDILQSAHCLELVLSGNNKVVIGKQTHRLTNGSIQFRRRGNYQMQPSKDYSALMFFMDDKFVLEFLKEHIVTFNRETFKADLPPFLFKRSYFIDAHVKETITFITKPQTFSLCIIKLSLHQVLLHILAVETSKTFASFLKYLVSERKVNLEYFMERNFTQHLTLPEIAKQTGRSLSAFKDDFHAHFGTSPSRWIMNRRLEYASYLLKNTGDPVSEVGYRCGFENLAHFSKSYRKKYGVTPSNSRKV